MAIPQSLRSLFDSMDKEIRKENMSKNSVFMVSIDLLIEDEGFNTRDYDTARVQNKIRDYADAFHRGDVFPPLQVKVVDGIVYIRDGYLRSRGARLAIAEGTQVERLACTEVDGDEGVQDLVILKSNDGLKLLPLERAAVYSRMMHSRGLSVEEISKLDGRAVPNIMQYITAFNLPLEMKRFINDEVVSMSYAISLFNAHGTKAAALIQDRLDKMPIKPEGQTGDLLGSKDEKPTGKAKNNNRITPKAMEAATGYRARFTPKLVAKVTDSLRELSAGLKDAKAEGDGFVVRLSQAQLDALKQLSEEVEPKAAKDEKQTETAKAKKSAQTQV